MLGVQAGVRQTTVRESDNTQNKMRRIGYSRRRYLLSACSVTISSKKSISALWQTNFAMRDRCICCRFCRAFRFLYKPTRQVVALSRKCIACGDLPIPIHLLTQLCFRTVSANWRIALRISITTIRSTSSWKMGRLNSVTEMCA